jgi:hypothetical protein
MIDREGGKVKEYLEFSFVTAIQTVEKPLRGIPSE